MFGMRLGKSTEAIDQPFGRKIRRSADGENTRTLALNQALGADGDAVQCIAHDGEVVAAGFGDDQPLAFAIEQLDAELRFQRLDLMADRALRDAQFFGGAREALMPRRGLEGLECVQWRQAAKHELPFMRKTKAG